MASNGSAWMRSWVALVLGAVVLSTGCTTLPPPGVHSMLRDHDPRAALGPELAGEEHADSRRAATNASTPARLLRRRGERVRGTEVAMVSPAEMAVRAVASGAVQVDAFEYLLALAGLDNFNDLPPRGASLTPQEAARVLSVMMNKPVTLSSFPPRMAACYLLREVLEEGEVSREELLRRVERFKTVVVLRPDGYLAWTLNGRTQQKVGPVEWKEDAFRAGPFELGRFYTVKGWVFQQADAQLRPVMEGPGLAEVYDDADYIGRSLEGAEEAFVELYHAIGQFLSHPSDSIAALRHLPAGVAALIASSPQYRERFRYMARGEQVKAASKLLTHLIVTFGTAGGTTGPLTRAVGGLDATVPVLSLSAEGLLVMERIVVPVGKAATVLKGGPWAAVIIQQAGGADSGASESSQGQMRPAAEELLQQATRLPPERLNGFRIFGNKGLVGKTFQRNVLLIEAETKGASSLKKLIAALEAEARAAGASRLSITGHAVINQGFLNPAIARRYGFAFRRINNDTIELVKELLP
jgi:hypothetical protein